MSVANPTPPSAAIDRENPWPRLASFTEDARAFFFGRKKETDELVRLVRRNRLTVLLGQSGFGSANLRCSRPVRFRCCARPTTCRFTCGSIMGLKWHGLSGP